MIRCLFGFALAALLTVGCMTDSAGTDGERIAESSDEVKSVIVCGGFAGLTCPGDLVCVDDPKDDCDPKNGGADCSGICKKVKGPKTCNTKGKKGGKVYVGTSPEQCSIIKFACEPGFEYFADECGCGCQPVQGAPCGPAICGAGQVCCNASCGICTEPGGFCIQIACEPS